MAEFLIEMLTFVIPFALFMTFFVSLPISYIFWYLDQKKKGTNELNYVNYLVWIKRNW